MRQHPRERLRAAIDALADVLPYGHLQAATDGGDMIQNAVDEISALRAENARLAARVAELERELAESHREADSMRPVVEAVENIPVGHMPTIELLSAMEGYWCCRAQQDAGKEAQGE